MKPNIQRKENIAQPPGRHVVGTSKVKKGTNRQKGPPQKASDVFPFTATEVVNRQLSVSEGYIGNEKEVDPLKKIKLQLFPVDEVTRIGLEKDGLNPFLELTLKARKKISSVIKHFHTKWGGSHIAIGEPMLLPYDAHLRHLPITRRWTSKDTIVSAGDVYSAVESPAIFRLSYGWFSDHDPQRGVSAATDVHNCIKSETIHKPIESSDERKCLDFATAEAAASAQDTEVKIGRSHELSQNDNMTNLSMGGPFSEASLQGNVSNNDLKSIQPSTDISIGGLLSEASLHGKFHNNELALNGKNMVGHQPAPITWDDNLTALSIGGLLSEASLQAKINNNKSDLKFGDTFISDSFDAIISSHVKTNCSSILDAEETCHAFAFRKFSSSTKNVRVTARSTQDSTSNPFRFPQLPEVERQAENTYGPELKLEPYPRPQQFSEDSRSLGLRGITWNESLGPFDLGNSMSWKVFGGGNV